MLRSMLEAAPVQMGLSRNFLNDKVERQILQVFHGARIASSAAINLLAWKNRAMSAAALSPSIEAATA